MTDADGIGIDFLARRPLIGADAFVAPSATLIGDVEIGACASIWYGCVLRADVNFIRVGARTNIQDGTVVHVDGDRPTFIGDDVTIGHMALIHACTVESGAFIGMRATLLDGVTVEGGAVIAAGALVPPGKRVPSGELWAGVPARHVRHLSHAERAGFQASAARYVAIAEAHRSLPSAALK